LSNLFATQQANAQANLTAAQNEQGIQLGGAESAASGVQPQTQYGALTNPVTGQPISSSGVVSGASSYSTEAQTALSALPTAGQNAVILEAQKLANNQETQDQAKANLSSYGQTGVTALNAILGPGFNANTNAGSSAAQQSNVSTAGTAGVTANDAVFQDAYKTYADLQNTTQNIDQFGNLLTQTMTDGGINPSDVKYANQTLSAVRNQLSSSQQAVYDNTLASLKSRVSGLLASGGSEIPSQITTDANKILDGSLPLSALSAVLTRIQAEGTILLQNQASKVNNAYSQIQSGGTGTSSGNSSSGTTKEVGGYTYTKDSSGKWVAK
jgi:hypothetical protein